jgi:hypothetical protein
MEEQLKNIVLIVTDQERGGSTLSLMNFLGAQA